MSDTIDITTGIKTVLATRKKRYPQHVNRISSLDDPCLRKLYYMRHDWAEAKETDDGLQGIFETGNILEPIVERIVSEIGLASIPQWRIIGSQIATDDKLLKEYQISGTIDGFLQVKFNNLNETQWITLGVVDIKTMSQNVYARVQDYESLSRFPWTRRYRGQVMLYSLAHNFERCFLLLVNKSNLFDMRLIEFPTDMEYCEGLLQKAKTVNESIANNEMPQGVNDPDICQKCQFLSFCAPDLSTGGNMEIIDNPELEIVLDRMAELKITADEYRDLEGQRDAMLIRGKDIMCGQWFVTWKSHDRKGKEVWTKRITRVPTTDVGASK